MLRYETRRASGPFLYWSAGASHDRYSFGIDIDAKTSRIVLAELRAYGGRIGVFPDHAGSGDRKLGVPIVDTSDAWRPGTPICDVGSLFELQLRDHDLRVDFGSGASSARVALGSDLELELNPESRVSAVVFRALDPQIIGVLENRYGRSE